jgi:hypothetical protein
MEQFKIAALRAGIGTFSDVRLVTSGLDRLRAAGQLWADFVVKVDCNGFGRCAFR